MGPQPPADIQSIASWNHDVEKKKRGGLTLRIGNHIIRGMENPGCKSSGFKMMLHQPRNVGVVFQYKYGLAQTGVPFTAACGFPRDLDDGISAVGVKNAGRSESLTD